MVALIDYDCIGQLSPAPVFGFGIMADQPIHTEEVGGKGQTRTQAQELEACAVGLMQAIDMGISNEVGPYDLTPIEFNLLRACMDMGECTATQLAAVLPVDASRISRVVNGLVNRGFLIRQRQTHDRRIVMLRLSDEGYTLTETLNQRVQLYDNRLMEGVTEEEMRAFIETTNKILANHESIRQS